MQICSSSESSAYNLSDLELPNFFNTFPEKDSALENTSSAYGRPASVKSANFDATDSTNLLNKAAAAQAQSPDNNDSQRKAVSDNKMKTDIVDISEEGAKKLKEENKVSQEKDTAAANNANKADSVQVSHKSDKNQPLSTQEINQISKKLASGAYVSESDMKLLKKNNPAKYKEAMTQKAQLQNR